MANENKPDTNHSQFFITLDATEYLYGKHTIFGKVVGNTLFNVLKMGDLQTDSNDHPIYPPCILCVSIVTRKKIINAILICAPIAVTSRKIISKISSQANSAFVLVVKTSLILI